MLAIDIVFFLLELIVGFVVSSLALMADAFHMVSCPTIASDACMCAVCTDLGLQLNDIISLLVGLWAVRVADKATTDRYSYGVRFPEAPLACHSALLCRGTHRLTYDI